MKKIFTTFIAVLFILSFSTNTFAQCLTCDTKDYAFKKAQFWNSYQMYKSEIDKNKIAIKPEDPNGLFAIDDNNNFVVNTPVTGITRGNNISAPWITGGERDAAANYVFSQSTTSYAPATGGTLLCAGGCDDGAHYGVPIGFTFNYNGTDYTTVSVTQNGWLTMGTASTLSGYSPIYTGSYPNAIAVFARDLYGLASGDTLRYQVTGVAPNRVFTVEWYHWGIYSSGLNELDFQVKLYETTNKIQFVYNPQTPTTSVTNVEVGIMGATNADFQKRLTTTNWSATTSGLLTDYCYFNSTVYPAAGLTFTWTPPPTGPMGYYSSNTVQISPSVPIAPGSINNQIIQVQVVDTGMTSPFTINRLRFQTTGSNNAALDLANAKLYYTRSVNSFSTTRQYGSTVTSPNGVFNFLDTATLDPNSTNYFWLTYDLNAGAIWPDSVDAQCDSLILSSIGGVTPTISAPAGSRPIDVYCRGTVTNAGCPYGLYITNVLFGNINNTSGCNGYMPYVYTPYPTVTTSIRQNNQYPITVTNQNIGNPNPTAFGIYIDWNNNNSFADASEYFPTTVIPANTTTSAYSTILVPAGSTLGSHRMRIRTNLSTPPGSGAYCTNYTYGEQEDYVLTVIADTNMTYSTSTTTQTVLSPVFTPSNNTQIIGIQVNTTGTISPISATSFTFNTAGTTNPSQDISVAKLYYTGLSSTFATSTFVGSYSGTWGSFNITGSQQLAQGVNYFWLTYDIPNSAPSGDTVDAQCTSITVGGTPRIPSITSPAGFRIIQGNSLCGTYNIPGNYPSIAAAIADLNLKGTPNCPVIYNIAAGYVEVAANLTINTTGTWTNTITFRKNGAGDNPRIQAAAGTGSYDGIIKLNGVNYITFDGIDVVDTSTNTTTTTQMEWGYALLRLDGTHGSSNITIKNCNIVLNKTNTVTYGIYSYTINLTGTTQSATAFSGTNSNNSFLNNNISNSYNGIYVYGYGDSGFPFSLTDHNNVVNGNTITNFGGSTTTTYGIYAYYQSNETFNNNIINSRGGINSTGAMYGIYNYHYYDNGDANVNGNTITLVDTTGSTGSQYGIYNYGYYANNDVVTNNIIRDCVNPATSAATYYIYNYCASGSALYRNNITLTGNKIINNSYGVAGTSTAALYHIYNYGYVNNSINLSNNIDSGNTILGTTSYVAYVIYNPGVANNTVINNNRIVNNIFCGTTATGTTYGIYGASGYFTYQQDSNYFANNSLPSTSSASMYCLYDLSPAPQNDFAYNTVTGNSGTGSGTIYSMFYSVTPAYGSVENVSYNTVTNQSKTTATGTGALYGIYKSGNSPGTVNVNNNTVTGFTSAAATTIYGIYQIGSPPNNLSIMNNKVGNFNVAGAGTIYGIFNNPTSSTLPVIAQDSVFNLTSAGGVVYGMYCVNGNPTNIYRNRISGIYSTTSTTATAYGMYIAGGTVNYVYNNFISDINATASTTYSTPAVTGLYIGGGTYDYVYYNTIYLKDTSTSATSFGCAGIYANTAYNVDLRNNVVINNSTPGPTLGNVVAYWRSSTTLTTYLSSANNNCFYAGTPGARNLIYFDGTNLVQTLSAYKTLVIPRDNNSATELPPFVNIASIPYDLRIQTGVGTQLESGGQVISTSGFPVALLNITQDAFGTNRYPNAGYPVGSYTPTAPDMGAHEFGGTNADLTPPYIAYTPLGIGGTSNRAFNNVVITDQSGVNVTTFKPRCYYKRSTDSNVVNGTNTSADDGWKYVVSNGTTSPFDFTIDYSKLVGGTGVANGNVIQYFVIAQDLASSVNVGAIQAIFAAAPVSDSLVSSNAPITNTLSYTIGTNTFAGNYNVGAGQTYTSLTGAAGIFAAINAGTVSGDITISVTSDMTEDGTNQLNALNETGPGNYKVKIVPSADSMRIIQGSVSQAMIRLNGVRNVTINGNTGTSGKYLTFRNYYGTTPTLQFQNETRLDTVKNCIIESNNTGTASGTIYFSTTTNALGFGNDSICINTCDIRDRSDVTGTPCNSIYAIGSTTTLNTYNNYCSVINCNIFNNFYDAGVFGAGIYLNSGNSNWTISGNSFYQTTARTIPANASSFLGIYVVSTLDNDIKILNNYFGGSAPLCGGSPLTISGAGAFTYYAMYLASGYLAPASVQGNTIQNFNLTYSGTSTMNFFRAVYVSSSTSWVNIGNLSGNTIGSGTGTGSITLTINTTASTFTIPMIQHFGFGSIMNNTIGSLTYAGNATSTGGDLYAAIYWSNTQAGQIYTMSNNLIGSLSTANSIQMTNNSNYHTFRGAYIINGAGTINNITNNIIANITSFSTTSLYLCNIYGIWYNSATAANVTMTGNTIRNLTNNCNISSASFGIAGLITSSYGVNTIANNNIYSLYSNGTTGAELVGGISAGGYNGGIVTQNKIYDLRHLGTGVLAPAPLVLGINVQSYGLYTVTNNMVSLTNGDLTGGPMKPVQNEKFEQKVVENPPVNLAAVPKDGKPDENTVTNTPSWSAFDETSWGIYKNNNNIKKQTNNIGKNEILATNDCYLSGIYYTSSNFRGTCNFFYNTIYLGGTQPVGYDSWDFIRTSTGHLDLRDNLFINARTGGNSYCVSNRGSLTEGWTSASSNYNAFVATNDAVIGEWGQGNAFPLTSWTANSGGDNQSWSTNTATIVPANLVTNIGSCDLRIQSGNASAWVVSGKGIAISGQNIDFEGNSRVTAISDGVTDIGADEFTATPPSNPTATQLGTIGAGAITNYVLYGRTILSIAWGIGGTSYPTSLAVNYYSGIPPTNTNTLGSNFGTSYMSAVPTGTLTGTTYSATMAFGDNETYKITSPASDYTILAKYNTTGQTFWQAYARGSSDLQSIVTWPNTIQVTGLTGFSNFALADGCLTALLTYPPHNSKGMPSTDTLKWNAPPCATSYLVQLGTDSTFASGIIVNDSSITGTSRIVSGLNNITSYFWRVRPKSAGSYGAFSGVYKFRTVGYPNVVTLIYPPNNSTNQPATIQFLWSKATEQLDLSASLKQTGSKTNEIDAIINYWYELVTDTVSMANLNRDSTLTDTTKTVSGLSYQTSYFWRVKAKNQLGWGAFTGWWKFTTLPPPVAFVSLTVIPGGFYNTSTGQLNMRDTIKVLLVDSATCTRVDSAKVMLDSLAFTANLAYSNAQTGLYYIYVYHRNHVVTSSRYRQNVIRGSSVSYDFTTDSTKAFGFNMIKVSTSPVRWGMIPADANQDGYIDGLDQNIWISQNGLDGYLAADFNGDIYVDGLDQNLWIAYNGLSYILPCELAFEFPSDHAKKVQTIMNTQIQNLFSPRKGNR